MKAFLIDPAAQQIEAVEFDGSRESIARLIGFDTIDSDEIGSTGDRLFFDEECFLRADPKAGRFQLDRLAPVSGRGLVTGREDAGSIVGDPSIVVDALRDRIRFS
jgi:hypothetical protein